MASKPDPTRDHVLITGACGDLGSHLVGHFLSQGLRVLGLDIAAKPPATTAGNERFSFAHCDLTKPAEVARAVEAFVAKYGAPRIVVNNAGLIFNAPVLTFEDGELKPHSAEDWDKVMAATLSSAFYVTAAVAKHMASSGGVIINISSISARGNPGQSAYSAAKGGLVSMTIAQAKELGPMGIRVAAIAPGFLDTSSTRRAMSEDALKKIQRAVPLRRLGRVEELVHAAQFIVENTYYTGTVLELDGGLSV